MGMSARSLMAVRWVMLGAAAPLLALMSSSPAVAGANRKAERIEMPGGIGSARFNAMWLAAKKKCYELDYTEIVEERELQTMVCKMDGLNLKIVFDREGFTIKADAFFSKMPIIGGISSQPRHHRREMIETLRAVR